MDSGMFYGIQKGAIEALKSTDKWFKDLNKAYQKRRELVWELADLLGCTYDKTTSGLFVWSKLPQDVDAETFIDKILYDKSIFITPGIIFGTQGKGYIRFSLCASEEELEESINRIKN